jgi:hypothetical protein
LRIGDLDLQTQCIDPIQDVSSFEKDQNESMIVENNYFINNENFSEQSLDSPNVTAPNFYQGEKSNMYHNSHSRSVILSHGLIKFDSTYDESYSVNNKHQKNTIKNTSSSNNKSELNLNEFGGLVGGVGQNQYFPKHKNSSFIAINNITKKKEPEKNLSCSLIIPEKKRGRKKCIPDGLKRELLNKALLRQFKNYLRECKLLKNIKIENDERVFWSEFSQNINPPIKFTIGDKKLEFKSFSTNLMKFIFSHNSVRVLYEQFSKEKDFLNNLLEKRIKHINDVGLRKFCLFYGMNLHNIYSSDNLSNSIENFDFMTLNNGSINDLANDSETITITTSAGSVVNNNSCSI